MTKDEALDMALEALTIQSDRVTEIGKRREAITAIKQARSAPVQEPESFEQWNAKQHGDPEEIGFLQALRIAYCAGQDSVTKATPPAAPVQEPVEFFDWYDNAHWGNEDFKEGCHRSWNAAIKYTTPPAAQRQWIGLTDEDLANCSGYEVRWALYWDKLLKGKNSV